MHVNVTHAQFAKLQDAMALIEIGNSNVMRDTVRDWLVDWSIQNGGTYNRYLHEHGQNCEIRVIV